RAVSATLVPDETVQTTLETCDAIRSLLGSLTHNGAGSPVSPELLNRLGIRTGNKPDKEAADGRDAAFLNTTSQCIEMIAGCLARLEGETEPGAPVFETYRRGLNTLSAAARYRNCQELEEPLAQQLRILDAAIRDGETLGSEQRSQLGTAFQSARSVLDRLSGGTRGSH